MTATRLPSRSEETYCKAVRPDGTDFYSQSILWDRVGEIVRHPNPGILRGGDAEGYLSVSVSPADCTGMEWPCRLFVVEPVEGVPVWKPTPRLPSKRASHAWRVVRELPAHEALGPNGVEVVAFLKLLPTLTSAQWDVARDVAREVTCGVAWDVTCALVARDLITTELFDTLTAPMRAAGINFDTLMLK